MRINPDKIFARDYWTCFLCAGLFLDGDLVPHHRGNRGAGGFKAANTPANVCSLCSLCNGLIEQSATDATRARKFGIKISKFDAGKADQIPVAMPISPGAIVRAWVVLDNEYNFEPASETHQEQIQRMDEIDLGGTR